MKRTSKNTMSYAKIFKEVKNKHFPELKEYKISFKQKRQKVFMNSNIFSMKDFLKQKELSPITYNKEILKQTPKKAVEAAIAHELCHKLQGLDSNPLKHLYMWVAYKLTLKSKVKLEREAHIMTVRKGFAEGLIQLRKSCEKRLKKDWDKKWSKLHLLEKEIKKHSRK